MPLSTGDKLGHYEVLSLLGKGGMGEVYRARDTQLKREVALKVLPSALSSVSESLTRFQREAELLASLDHPNIGISTAWCRLTTTGRSCWR
jgi:serine/threonine protein kinase